MPSGYSTPFVDLSTCQALPEERYCRNYCTQAPMIPLLAKASLLSPRTLGKILPFLKPILKIDYGTIVNGSLLGPIDQEVSVARRALLREIFEGKEEIAAADRAKRIDSRMNRYVRDLDNSPDLAASWRCSSSSGNGAGSGTLKRWLVTIPHQQRGERDFIADTFVNPDTLLSARRVSLIHPDAMFVHDTPTSGPFSWETSSGFVWGTGSLSALTSLAAITARALPGTLSLPRTFALRPIGVPGAVYFDIPSTALAIQEVMDHLNFLRETFYASGASTRVNTFRVFGLNPSLVRELRNEFDQKLDGVTRRGEKTLSFTIELVTLTPDDRRSQALVDYLKQRAHTRQPDVLLDVQAIRSPDLPTHWKRRLECESGAECSIPMYNAPRI